MSATVNRLTAEALSEIDQDTPLSAVLAMAQRIARLRQDWEAVYWLSLETRAIGDTGARDRAFEELSKAIGGNEALRVHQREVEAYVTERQVPQSGSDEEVLAVGIAEIEEQIRFFESERANASSKATHANSLIDRDENQKIRDMLGFAITQRRQVLSRVRSRVRDYLSSVEAALVVAASVSEIFEANRAFVERKLYVIAPGVVAQLQTAAERIGNGSDEALSQAMTSCRRSLKSFTDALSPATGELATGIDGVQRKMTDDHYIARLLQHLYETMRETRSRELLQTQIQGLGERLEAVNSASHKGVHADVNDFEARQCLIQTYLTIGDMLKMLET